jgi:hypothetical protein
MLWVGAAVCTAASAEFEVREGADGEPTFDASWVWRGVGLFVAYHPSGWGCFRLGRPRGGCRGAQLVVGPWHVLLLVRPDDNSESDRGFQD